MQVTENSFASPRCCSDSTPWATYDSDRINAASRAAREGGGGGALVTCTGTAVYPPCMTPGAGGDDHHPEGQAG